MVRLLALAHKTAFANLCYIVAAFLARRCQVFAAKTMKWALLP